MVCFCFCFRLLRSIYSYDTLACCFFIKRYESRYDTTWHDITPHDLTLDSMRESSSYYLYLLVFVFVFFFFFKCRIYVCMHEWWWYLFGIHYYRSIDQWSHIRSQDSGVSTDSALYGLKDESWFIHTYIHSTLSYILPTYSSSYVFIQSTIR